MHLEIFINNTRIHSVLNLLLYYLKKRRKRTDEMILTLWLWFICCGLRAVSGIAWNYIDSIIAALIIINLSLPCHSRPQRYRDHFHFSGSASRMSNQRHRPWEWMCAPAAMGKWLSEILYDDWADAARLDLSYCTVACLVVPHGLLPRGHVRLEGY